MQGPFPQDSLGNLNPPSGWNWENGRLVRGQDYGVVQEFIDADDDLHGEGEEWRFIASAFSRYDGELILMVRFQSGEEWQISLLESVPAQLVVIENFTDYVVPVNRGST